MLPFSKFHYFPLLTKNTSRTKILPLGEFHHFPLLPLELRSRIWVLSLPPPRLVDIYSVTGKLYLPAPINNSITIAHVHTNKTPVPNILQINREARIIGLSHYQLRLDSNALPSIESIAKQHGWDPLSVGLRLPTTSAMIYVNLARDMLVRRYKSPSIDNLDASRRFKVQHPAIAQFKESGFLSLDPQLVQRVRCLVFLGMPEREEDFTDMRMYFMYLTGLRGVVLVEPQWGGQSMKWKAKCCGNIARELEFWSSQKGTKVRICSDEALKAAIEERSIWDDGFVEEWD